jgi:hypothetical protein
MTSKALVKTIPEEWNILDVYFVKRQEWLSWDTLLGSAFGRDTCYHRLCHLHTMSIETTLIKTQGRVLSTLTHDTKNQSKSRAWIHLMVNLYQLPKITCQNLIEEDWAKMESVKVTLENNILTDNIKVKNKRTCP